MLSLTYHSPKQCKDKKKALHGAFFSKKNLFTHSLSSFPSISFSLQTPLAVQIIRASGAVFVSQWYSVSVEVVQRNSQTGLSSESKANIRFFQWKVQTKSDNILIYINVFIKIGMLLFYLTLIYMITKMDFVCQTHIQRFFSSIYIDYLYILKFK